MTNIPTELPQVTEPARKVRTTIKTFSGVDIDLFDPDYNRVMPVDIAHGLAGEIRYNAQSPVREPVAHHCTVMSRFARSGNPEKHPAISALIEKYGVPDWSHVAQGCHFHDAPEALVGDIVSPLKRQPKMAWFQILESTHMARVIERFKLPPLSSVIWHFVEAIDRAIVYDEKQALWPDLNLAKNDPRGLGVVIDTSITMERAKLEWLEEYEVVTGRSWRDNTPVVPKQYALARAQEMMRVPMGDLPEPALKYAAYLCNQVGMCMEVLLSAWATHAQIAEGLPCSDPGYPADRAGYEEAQRTYEVLDLGNGNRRYIKVRG